MPSLLTFTSIAMLLVLETQGVLWYNEKYSHTPKPLSTEELRRLATVQTKTTFESLLDPMLIPRVSGSENNVMVREYIKNHMKTLGWTVEKDAFESPTPHGVKKFENVIATLNPNSPRRLVLACHYDSKYFRENNFVGATDSAVPCAMMLHLAYTLQNPLELHRQSAANNVTLQFIFFDGEEAFNHWSDTDSLYGARHLAELMEKTPYPPGNTAGTNELHRMDMLMLLDLIGTANPTFPNFFESTSHWHNQLVEIETVLRNGRMWSGNVRGRTHFKSQSSYGGVEDDHIPFQQRNVDILHVIAVPFPKVWHTPEDDREHLHFETIHNLNGIFRVFVGRYLHLSVHGIGPTDKLQAASGSQVPKYFTSTTSTTFLVAFIVSTILVFFLRCRSSSLLFHYSSLF